MRREDFLQSTFCLDVLFRPEADIQKMRQQGSGCVEYSAVTGLNGETEHVSEEEEEEEEDHDSNASEEEDEEVPRGFVSARRPKDESKEEKAERKKALREAKAEKRKEKIPKHVKKKKEKSTKK